MNKITPVTPAPITAGWMLPPPLRLASLLYNQAVLPTAINKLIINTDILLFYTRQLCVGRIRLLVFWQVRLRIDNPVLYLLVA